MRKVLPLLIACVPALAFAQAGPVFFSLDQVKPGVYVAIDNPDHSDFSKVAYSNGGFIVGKDVVLVVDAFFDTPPAEALLAEIRKVTDKPIRYLVNTHYHLDHVTGDAVFHDAGAKLVVNRNARGWIKDLNMANTIARGRLTPAAKAIYDRMPAPDILVDKPMTIDLGGRAVEIRPASGHTGGDLFVVVPDAHVVFAGDLLWRRRIPQTFDGNDKALLAELAAFQRLPKDTTFVPGHGDVATQADVADFRAQVAAVVDETAAARRAGLAGDPLVAAVKAKLKPRYGDWFRFEQDIDHEIQDAAEEQAGTKKVPQPQP
jgi:glyoxylase-like metal-dependent hydrolase (beta-lactamase superfamily II)